MDVNRDRLTIRSGCWGINRPVTEHHASVADLNTISPDGVSYALTLQLRNKVPKRRVKAKLRDDRTVATSTNQIWAMDFVHDQLATGRKIRILTIVDTFSRFSPAVDPRFSYRGEDVVLALETVCKEVGYPQSIRVDQGSEFISRDLDLWAYQKGVILDFSR
jgi:putative transposase